jgi:hypothetical protein
MHTGSGLLGIQFGSVRHKVRIEIITSISAGCVRASIFIFCSLRSLAAIAPIESLERCMATLHAQNIETHRPDFERLARIPCPIASFSPPA